MTYKNIKIILLMIILIITSFILLEFYTLIVNSKERDILLNKNHANKTLISDLENEINDLNKIVNENETKLNSLEEKREYLTNKIVEVEDLINKKEELEATISTGSKYIDGVITVNQNPYYPTGCETVALFILLRYYNVYVSVDDIISNLKKGDLPHFVDGKFYGANPEKEFVGSPLTEYSYGVFNEPIKEVANKFKSGAKTETNKDFDEVLELVNEGRPVIVWATIGMIEPYISSTWTDYDGEKVNWIANEHALVVIGYDKNNIIVSDPYTGTIRYYNRNLFISRYNYLGKRAVWY